MAEYRARAEQGDPEAQNKLGAMYFTGKGVEKDYGEAVRWYSKSAEQGYAKAEYNLSNMYRYGKGVPQNFVEAGRWCRKAAEQGNVTAQEGLGYLYYRGEGVPQDYAEAARWYQKSAEQGDANAQYVLGYMYYYGYGVERDRIGAMRLFRQAAAQGNDDAKRALGPVRWSTTRKAITFVELAGILVLGVGSLKSAGKHHSRADTVRGVTALLLTLVLAVDLLRLYVGYMQSLQTLTWLHLGKHFLGGITVGLLAYVLHKKSAKIVLIASAAIFVGVIGFAVIFSELRQAILGVLPLDSLLGLSIGMSISSAILLWVDRKGKGQMAGDRDQAAMPLSVKPNSS